MECGIVHQNTGIGPCDTPFGSIKWLIPAPNNAKITPSDAANIIQYLNGKFAEPEKEDRWYPIMREVQTGATANTDPTMINYENGDTYQVLGGSAIYQASWYPTLCFDKTVNKFNRYEGGLYVINMENKLWGLFNPDGSLSPYQDAKISVSGGFFQPTGTTPTSKMMQITFGDLIDMENGSGFIDLGKSTNLKTVLVGLSDLNPIVVQAVGGTASIKLRTECDNTDVTAQYQTQFASVDMWRAYDVNTGAEVPISAATYDATLNAFSLGIASDDPVRITGAPVNVLAEHEVVGYEVGEVTVTVAA